MGLKLSSYKKLTHPLLVVSLVLLSSCNGQQDSTGDLKSSTDKDNESSQNKSNENAQSSSDTDNSQSQQNNSSCQSPSTIDLKGAKTLAWSDDSLSEAENISYSASDLKGIIHYKNQVLFGITSTEKIVLPQLLDSNNNPINNELCIIKSIKFLTNKYMVLSINELNSSNTESSTQTIKNYFINQHSNQIENLGTKYSDLSNFELFGNYLFNYVNGKMLKYNMTTKSWENEITLTGNIYLNDWYTSFRHTQQTTYHRSEIPQNSYIATNNIILASSGPSGGPRVKLFSITDDSLTPYDTFSNDILVSVGGGIIYSLFLDDNNNLYQLKIIRGGSPGNYLTKVQTDIFSGITFSSTSLGSGQASAISATPAPCVNAPYSVQDMERYIIFKSGFYHISKNNDGSPSVSWTTFDLSDLPDSSSCGNAWKYAAIIDNYIYWFKSGDIKRVKLDGVSSIEKVVTVGSDITDFFVFNHKIFVIKNAGTYVYEANSASFIKLSSKNLNLKLFGPVISQ